MRAARTSHGTFYLYFTNKEDLLRALATECGLEISALADTLGPVGLDADGYLELRAFLGRFFGTYRRYGPVIRAWMEGHVEDREVGARRSFVHRHRQRTRSPHPRGRRRGTPASISALMALLERFAYFLVSRRLEFDADAMLDTVTHIVHRGFFAAPLELSAPVSRSRRFRSGGQVLGRRHPAGRRHLQLG